MLHESAVRVALQYLVARPFFLWSEMSMTSQGDNNVYAGLIKKKKLKNRSGLGAGIRPYTKQTFIPEMLQFYLTLLIRELKHF